MKLRFPDYVATTRCILLTVALVTGLLTPKLAGAQEGSGDDIQVLAGPYKIRVASSVPVPAYSGDVYFIITVLDATTEQPVPGARVRILTSNVADGTEGWAWALSAPEAAERYQAKVTLETPGTWYVNVEVRSALGEVLIKLPPLELPRKIGSNAGGIVFAGVLVVLMLGGVYVWWSVRREQRRRVPLPAGEGNQADGRGEH